MEDSKKKKTNGIIAPLKLVKIEKIYITWLIAVLIFGQFTIILDLFNWNIENLKAVLYEKQLYTFSIALCAPFSITFLIELIINKKSNQPNNFVSYKVTCLIINMILIFLMNCFLLGANDSKFNIFLQILLYIVSLVFSFYMYCISEMNTHLSFFKEYDDSNYVTQEGKSMEKTEKKASELKSIPGQNGEVKI